MSQSVKKRKHVLADKIPVILAAALILLVEFLPGVLMSSLVEDVYCAITHENLLDYVMAGEELPWIIMPAYLISSIVFAFLLLYAFEWWFKDEYDGSVHVRGFGKGMKVAAPIIIFWIVWYIIQIAIGTSVAYMPTAEVMLQGFRAGIVEEAAYRGIGTALLLRAYKDKTNILMPTILSAALFGLSHLINISSGGDVLEVLAQTLFATVFGIISGLIFTSSGNIWPTILFHSLYDAATFFVNGLGDGFVWTNIIDILGPMVIMIFMLMQFNKEKDRASELWHKKWIL